MEDEQHHMLVLPFEEAKWQDYVTHTHMSRERIIQLGREIQ